MRAGHFHVNGVDEPFGFFQYILDIAWLARTITPCLIRQDGMDNQGRFNLGGVVDQDGVPGPVSVPGSSPS